MKIALLPFDQLKLSQEDLIQKIPQSEFDMQSFLQGKNISFFHNAKSAIHYIIQKHKLKRDDEVYISTTSDSNFVSTCVSATIFNHCKISRVITEKTKLIFIIHEFGFYNTRTEDLSGLAKQLGIPLVEDSAHSLTTSFKDNRVGKYADYTIFSLPKSIPVQNGGILLSNEKMPESINNLHVKNEFEKNVNFFDSFNHKRQELYTLIDSEIEYKSVFGDVMNNVPFAYVFRTEKYEEINTLLEKKNVQVLRTYNKGWVGIPVNPFLNRNDFFEIIELVNNK